MLTFHYYGRRIGIESTHILGVRDVGEFCGTDGGRAVSVPYGHEFFVEESYEDVLAMIDAANLTEAPA